MRWKISHRGHDPRQLDLFAAVALIIVIVAAFRFVEGIYSEPPSASTLIVPSQSVHW